MPVIIKDGVTNALASVDSTAKAIHGTLYDSAGYEPSAMSWNSFSLGINPVVLTAIAAGSYFWEMRNGVLNAKTVYIRRIVLITSFNGGGVGPQATTSLFDIVKFWDDDFSGGVAINLTSGIIRKRDKGPFTGITDVRQASTALTGSTSLVTTQPLAAFGCPRSQDGAVSYFDIQFDAPNEFNCLPLLPGEGLAFKTHVASVAGDAVAGEIEWDER